MNFLKFFGLDKYINFSKNIRIKHEISKHVIADVYESFLAAVYLQYGIDKVREIIYDILTEEKILYGIDFFDLEENEFKKQTCKEAEKKKQVKVNKNKIAVIDRPKINYKKIFKHIIGKKTQVSYKEVSRLSNRLVVNLEVKGKIISQGIGAGKKTARIDAVKNACIKLITEDDKNTINYKFIIQNIFGKNSQIEYMTRINKINNCVINLMVNGKCIAEGTDENRDKARQKVARETCLKYMK